MPITIQEIIASDTISQLVDKTNFNFDQLLLNGGGPAGPAGIQGPTGPAGGRGQKGSTWYEDTATTGPGTIPTASFPTTTPLTGDYYLQFNGQVWEYVTNAWVITTIDLEGPIGPAGQSGGFGDSFGSPSINLETALYNAPSADSLGNGATSSNQGIPSIMIGGVVSTTQKPPGGFTLTDAYIIPNDIAEQVISDRVSTLIHQKNSTTKAIVFHGGSLIAADKMEQTDFNNLSSIGISLDDRFIINGAGEKDPTTPQNLDEIVGVQVISNKRGQLYEAGKFVTFSTGNDDSTYSGITTADSDFTVNVNEGGTGGGGIGNKFIVTAKGTGATSSFGMGNIAIPNTTPLSTSGNFGIQAANMRVATSANGRIDLFSGGQISLDTTLNSTSNGSGSIRLKTKTGDIDIKTESPNDILSQQGNILIRQLGSSVGARANIVIENRSTLPNSSTGGDIKLSGNSSVSIRRQTAASVVDILASPSMVIDYGTTAFPEHRRIVGQTTYSAVGQSNTINPLKVNNLYNKVQFYYDASIAAVSATGQTLMQMGSNDGDTNMSNGAVFSKWINTGGANSGNSAASIRIGKGSDYTGLLELAGRADNIAQVQGEPEWWNLNEKEVMWAVPEIINRDSRRGSNSGGYDNSPTGSSTAGTPSIYAYDTARLSGGTSISAIIAKLEQPFIDVTIGPEVKNPQNLLGTSINENKNYTFEVLMPEGLIAGSRYEIDIQHRSAAWYEKVSGISFYKNFWGTVLFKVPIMRAKLGTSSTWQPWVYQEYNITAPEGVGGDTDGKAYVARLAGVLTWNGAIRSSAMSKYTSSNAGTAPKDVDVQMGWSTGGLPDTIPVINLHGDYLS